MKLDEIENTELAKELSKCFLNQLATLGLLERHYDAQNQVLEYDVTSYGRAAYFILKTFVEPKEYLQ